MLQLSEEIRQVTPCCYVTGAEEDHCARRPSGFLASFPLDEGSPSINYQLADLLLEHEDFGQSAREYERTAYNYPPGAPSG